MTVHIPTRLGLSLLVAGISILSASYAVIAIHANPSAQTEQAHAILSSEDVPDSVYNALQQHIVMPGDVEWVVTPDATANGYDVAVTVELAVEGDGGSKTDAMAEDTYRYFTSVFSTSVPITNAQIYFTNDGQVVGGGSLGVEAYHQMSVSTTTTPFAFVQTLEQQPVHESEDAQTCWYQVDTSNVQ